ncbi:MAG: DUF4340 domain-containing protein [Clostridia bacterium]|nr:DUF4340 domain-containing protein [Clostridia bacterium]
MGRGVLKNKKIIMLASVLVALIAVYFIVEYVIPDNSNNSSHNTSNASSDSQLSDEIAEEPIGVMALYETDAEFASSGRSHHDTITSVTIKNDDTVISFVKSNNLWKSGENENVSVSDSEIKRLTVNLCSLTYVDVIDAESVNYEDCGIDSESSYVSFDNEYGINVVYTLGYSIPETDMYYLKTSFSDDVYMVKARDVNNIFKSGEDYRSDKLHRVDFDNITKIYLKNSKTEFLLEKGRADINNGIYYEWRMTSPYVILANDENVKTLLISPGASLEAQDYASDAGDFANYGLDGRENMIVYEDVNGKGQTVYFSELINNSYYISIDDNPNIYKISRDHISFADISIIDIADRAIYKTNRKAISKVVFAGGEYDYEIVFNNDNTMKINSVTVTDENDTSDIFRKICDMLNADDMKNTVDGEKLFEIVFYKTDNTRVVLEFYPDGERYFTVCKNGTPMYYIMKSKIDKLTQYFDSYIK